MAIVSFATLKSYFTAGARPTQTQFENLIDSLSGRVTETVEVGVDASVATVDGATQWELQGTVIDRDHIIVFVNGAQLSSWTLCSNTVCFDYLLEDGYKLFARYWS
jgi:type IV secretory pathway VirB2 component (pilin)